MFTVLRGGVCAIEAGCQQLGRLLITPGFELYGGAAWVGLDIGSTLSQHLSSEPHTVLHSRASVTKFACMACVPPHPSPPHMTGTREACVSDARRDLTAGAYVPPRRASVA